MIVDLVTQQSHCNMTKQTQAAYQVEIECIQILNILRWMSFEIY